jgi:REP element-mobilizing transposase RayT
VFVHLVWATWNRELLLAGEVERHVYRCLEATCRELEVDVLAMGGIEDHVHLVVRLPAILSVATLVKRLKGASSHLITHEVTPQKFFKMARRICRLLCRPQATPPTVRIRAPAERTPPGRHNLSGVRADRQNGNHLTPTAHPIEDGASTNRPSQSESAQADFAAARPPGANSFAGRSRLTIALPLQTTRAT